MYVRQVQTGTLRVVLRTLCQQLPDVSKMEHMSQLAAPNDGSQTHHLPYGLDIWSAPEKVLNVSWDDTGNCILTTFQPGLWETTLEDLTIDHESWAG
jgi:hypothetical protein